MRLYELSCRVWVARFNSGCNAVLPLRLRPRVGDLDACVCRRQLHQRRQVLARVRPLIDVHLHVAKCEYTDQVARKLTHGCLSRREEGAVGRVDVRMNQGHDGAVLDQGRVRCKYALSLGEHL
jgi:hypothetical protein